MEATSLAAKIKDRRSTLRLSMQKAADLAGVHRLTWRSWENGSTPEDYNHAGIERALRWNGGSVAAILTGGEPTLLPDSQRLPRTDEQEQLMAVYLSYRRRGLRHKEAKALIAAQVDEMNNEDEQRDRPTG